MGRHALLQGIFLTQGSNPHLRHRLRWQVGSLPLVPSGKLEQEHLYFLRGADHFVFVMLSPLSRCVLLPIHTATHSVGVEVYHLKQGSG